MKKFVARQTNARWKKLSSELRRAAEAPQDAEAIHDLRVSIRRFVQCLRGFGGFFDEGAVQAARKPLRKLMRRCGSVRNCDISIELLQAVGLGEDPAVEMLRARRAEEEAVLVQTLRRWRKRKLEWKESPRDPRGGPWKADEPPAANAARVLPAMFADLLQAGHKAAGARASYKQIHRFRIEGKRFRYTVELFETFYGDSGAARLKELKSLQDTLGELNDCVTALELLAGHRLPQAAIRKQMKQRKEMFRKYWKDHFGAAAVKLWISTFSDTEKPSREAPASKKRPARSRRKASAT